MIGVVAERRAAKKAFIVSEAWTLARSEGIGGITLRALARRVGMQQPSLYEYFESKSALYDEMFADGNRQLLVRLEAVKTPADPRPALKRYTRAFVDFALEDQARLQLLFQRPIPGFVPSADSYALAEQVLNQMTQRLSAAGITHPDDIDCYVAVVGGIIAAQDSNEPGGNRWTRHLNRMIDLHLDHAQAKEKP
jgi:AcrR family transcriptional regulator